MAKPNISAERVRELLDYDPETGLLRWRAQRCNVAAGSVAGSPAPAGAVRIGIDGVIYLAHRLAWLYVNGEWPKMCIDHINGDPKDNRIANLRDVRIQVNSQNRRKPRRINNTGLIGAAWDERRGHYIARIRDSERQRTRYIGSFATAEEAHAAYVQAKRQMHEGNTL